MIKTKSDAIEYDRQSNNKISFKGKEIKDQKAALDIVDDCIRGKITKPQRDDLLADLIRIQELKNA